MKKIIVASAVILTMVSATTTTYAGSKRLPIDPVQLCKEKAFQKSVQCIQDVYADPRYNNPNPPPTRDQLNKIRQCDNQYTLDLEKCINMNVKPNPLPISQPIRTWY